MCKLERIIPDIECIRKCTKFVKKLKKAKENYFGYSIVFVDEIVDSFSFN